MLAAMYTPTYPEFDEIERGLGALLVEILQSALLVGKLVGNLTYVDGLHTQIIQSTFTVNSAMEFTQQQDAACHFNARLGYAPPTVQRRHCSCRDEQTSASYTTK